MTTTSRPNRLGVGIRAQLKQLAAEAGVVGAIVVAVLVCALFLTATPLLFSRMADEALLEAVSKPQAQLRNVTASLRSTIAAGPAEDPFIRVSDRGESFRDSDLPSSVQHIVHQTTWVADSPQFIVGAMPGTDDRPLYSSGRYAGTLMRMRYQADVDDHVSLVAGSLPQAHEPITLEFGEDCAIDREVEATEEQLDCRKVETAVFEVAVTRETLDYLPVDVGGFVLLTPNVDDSAFFALPREELQYNIALRISALIEIDDPAAEYWFNDPRLLRPRVRSNADFTFVFSTGLMSPEDYRRLLRQTGSARWNYQWRYFVSPDRISNQILDQLSADLAKLQGEYRPSAFAGASKIGVSTKLPEFITEYNKRRATTQAVMSTSVAGLTILTISMVMLLSAISTERQRSNLTLLRTRGASRLQMGLARAMQGLVLVLPPALLAVAVAVWLIPASTGPPWRLIIALVALATSFFVVASMPVIFGNAGLLQRRQHSFVAPSRRRSVADGLVVVAAVAAVMVVRRRGFVGTAEGELDLLFAVTPALVAVGAGLLLVRLAPYPVRALAYLGSRRRGLTMFIGFRRVLQQPAAAKLPLVVMLIAVALAAFSLVTRSSLQDAQVQASWQQAGAAFRLTGENPASPLGGEPDATMVESVSEQATGTRFFGVRTRDNPDVPSDIDVLFVQLAEYTAVNAGTPADPNFPASLAVSHEASIGSTDDPLPVIFSGGRGDSVATGQRFTIELVGRIVHVEVVEARSDFPSMSTDRAMVIADLSHLESLVGPHRARPTALYVRADASAAAELETALSSQTLSAVLSSQHDVLASIRADRFSRGLDQSLKITFWSAIFLSALAAVASLVQSSSERRRDFGYLRTQGLAVRQAVWLTLIEQAPTIIIASVAGVVTGVATAVLLKPAINLAPFTGSPVDGGLSIDPLLIGGIGVAIMSGLLLVSSTFGYAKRRQDFGGLLREDGE